MSQDIREIFHLSPNPRVRVFRRTLHGLEDFEGMEVDAYVVLGKSTVVFLDTLLCPADMVQVMALVEPEIGDRQILCVNSHADWDHAWGNGYFADHLPHAPILAHDLCRQRLLSPTARFELNDYKTKTTLFQEVTLTPPLLTFSEHLTISDADLPIELLYAPGHETDHIVAWLPTISLLLAFDAVESPLPGIADRACVPLMFATLARLEALNAQTVLCSHGNSSSPDLIRANLTYLNELTRRIKEHLPLFESRDTDDEHIAEDSGYPFAEVVAHLTGEIDRVYYNWAHEHNAQAILGWLRAG